MFSSVRVTFRLCAINLKATVLTFLEGSGNVKKAKSMFILICIQEF